ncbi:hypothetical protein COO91_03102 [Nostoc flagelliforme CCNUN1]|uniref:Uncharacterized protein n=1 Tax=Nostoc flagelliforme CCNUN1 TaxID=2038116 RepID=A0A2K8SNV8_9NOSO|nr:hypothetical protein COO91_03102 [Nostoc flagelliforme CCNUN1]
MLNPYRISFLASGLTRTQVRLIAKIRFNGLEPFLSHL